MTTSTDKPAALLDAHGNHHQRHGDYTYGVAQFTRLGVQRSPLCLYATTDRNCRNGELATVVMNVSSHGFSAYVRMTPDDADAMAAGLQQAAATARQVNALLEVDSCA